MSVLLWHAAKKSTGTASDVVWFTDAFLRTSISAISVLPDATARTKGDACPALRALVLAPWSRSVRTIAGFGAEDHTDWLYVPQLSAASSGVGWNVSLVY